MSWQHQERDQQERKRWALHQSGGFTEAVHDPGDSAADRVPEATQRSSASCVNEVIGERGRSTKPENSSEEEKRGQDQQRDGNHKPNSMKTACQSIHGASLRFTTSRCLLTPISARGPAVATLASFALMAWVIAGGGA